MRRKARVCRACGSSAEDGWSDERDSSPEELGSDFDYDDWLAREQGSRRPHQRWSTRAIVIVVVLVIAAWLVVWALGGWAGLG